MERLLHEGEVYMNTLAYYRDEEKNRERHDPNEGIERILQLKGAVLKQNNRDGKSKVIATLTNGVGRIKNSNLDKIAIYSMFHFVIPDEQVVELSEVVDERILQGFGDTAVTIYDAVDFATKVKNVALKRGMVHSRHRVEYVDMSARHDEEVGPFLKDLTFAHQKELRIAVINRVSGPRPIILNIGSIKDIACLVPAQDVRKITIESCVSG